MDPAADRLGTAQRPLNRKLLGGIFGAIGLRKARFWAQACEYARNNAYLLTYVLGPSCSEAHQDAT